MTVTISSLAHAQILDHCAATPECEACGLLFGDETRIERAEPTANVAAEPDRSFEIDPAALFAAIRAERAGGARLIGHYHSHPDGTARPSHRDAAMALDSGRLWVIVADGRIACWRAAKPGSFEPVELSLASP